ncbi:Ras- protein Rab-31 [Tritrichomonas musculus]|uniref:Ras- protein Rab-31 n=1 Tax=Tritrichomonas musculus TaxID=1915356 RepID=A0ABR2KGP2_9EUKA
MTIKEAKTVIVGSTGVGKTCIAGRAFVANFDPKVPPEPTLGAQFCEGIFPIDDGGDQVKFQIWDTAGQEAYRSLAPIFFKNSVIAILVFDITKAKTLQELDYYSQILNEHEPNCFKAIVGNKIDLEDQRQVSPEEGRNYAKKVGTDFYIETSAFRNENINELFSSLAKQNLKFIVQDPVVVPIRNTSEPKKKCC